MEPREGTSLSREDRLDHVIAEYLHEMENGGEPDREAWLKRYPELADELEEFFEDQDQFQGFMGQLQDSLPSSSFFDRTTRFPHPTETTQNESGEEPDDCLIPDPQPRYLPRRLHAKGGMGEVWVARDQRIGRRVALKRLIGRSKNRQARFMAEVRVTGSLEHPSIVPLHDVGVDRAGCPYYVMKFVEGETLRDRIRAYHDQKQSDSDRNVRFVQLLRSFVDVCHAVSFAHSRGVLHRDLKPTNVMIGAFGETVLLDWGLAKVVDQEDFAANASHAVEIGSAETHDGVILGSPAYMAPEAAGAHKDSIDERTDVYLLGSTLYEILTGDPPRKGKDPYELLEQMLFKQPPPPCSIKRDIPRPLDAICVKAMAFRKEDRYQSAQEVASEIERYLAREAVHAYKEGLAEKSLRWCRRHTNGARYGALLCALAIACFFAFRSVREASELRHEQLLKTELEQFDRFADEAHFFAANVDPLVEAVPYYEPRYGANIGLSAVKLADRWGENFEGLPVEKRAPAKRKLADLILVLLHTGTHQKVFADEQTVEQLQHRLRELRPELRTVNSLTQRFTPASPEASAAEDSIPWTATDYFLAGEKLRLLARNPQNPTFDAAQAEQESQRLLQAVRQYEKALALQPDHYWALLQLGHCYLCLDRPNEAIALLQGCVTLRPNAPWGYLARSVAFTHLGQFDRAAEELERLAANAPSFRPLKLARAINLFLAGKLDEAAPLLKDQPEEFHSVASFYLGELALQREQFEEALPFYQEAVSDLSTPTVVHQRLATVYFLIGDLEKGLAELEYCFPANLQGARKHLARAEFLKQLSLKSEADSRIAKDLAALQFKEVQQACQLDGNSADLVWQAASALERMGHAREALGVYNQGLTLDPSHEKMRLQRGWLFVALGKWSDALQDFEHVASGNPESAEAHTGIGYVLACTGKVDEAEDAAVRAVLHGQTHYLVLHNVSCIYAKLAEARQSDRDRYLNLAMQSLSRAFAMWERQGRIEPSELQLAQQESAFSSDLRSRPDFQALLEQASTP